MFIESSTTPKTSPFEEADDLLTFGTLDSFRSLERSGRVLGIAVYKRLTSLG
jgi:hypothetical protein